MWFHLYMILVQSGWVQEGTCAGVWYQLSRRDSSINDMFLQAY